MGRAGHGRRAFKTPAGRAHDARDALIGTLGRLKEELEKGHEVAATQFQNELLSVFATAESVRTFGMPVQKCQNLLKRDPSKYEVLEHLVMKKLHSGSGPTVIFGILRWKARELGVPI
ncbi:hypothetical protein HYW59_03620 [Candidatus Kaiserbacteria bacterium]|nr:hypothetical protein [Candidatus Kaiserbacteria bacterium]